MAALAGWIGVRLPARGIPTRNWGFTEVSERGHGCLRMQVGAAFDSKPEATGSDREDNHELLERHQSHRWWLGHHWSCRSRWAGHAALVHNDKPPQAPTQVQAPATKPVCPGDVMAQAAGICRQPGPPTSTPAGPPASAGQGGGSTAPDVNIDVQNNSSDSNSNSSSNSNSNSSSANNSIGDHAAPPATTLPTAPPVTTPPTAPPPATGGFGTVDPDQGLGSETHCWVLHPCLQ
jgi:hypothetical protein